MTFENMGYFKEYYKDGKFLGYVNFCEKDRKRIGYMGRITETIETKITLHNKKILKPGKYITILYPLCGKLKEQL